MKDKQILSTLQISATKNHSKIS